MSSIHTESERLYVRSHVFHPAARSDEGSDVAARDLLLAALGACTESALRRHAHARGWSLGEVSVDVAHVEGEGLGRIGRLVEVEGPLDDVQRDELERVCADTPVTRILADRATITTLLVAG